MQPKMQELKLELKLEPQQELSQVRQPDLNKEQQVEILQPKIQLQLKRKLLN